MTLRQPRVAVLGAGSWGTTVAAIVSRGTPTTIWARNPETAAEINAEHTNNRYLGDARLPAELTATADLDEAVSDVDVIVTAIPAQSLRSVLTDVAPQVRPWIPIVNLAKGLEGGTHRRMTEVIFDAMPGHPAGALSGPNIAGEVARGMAAAATLAMPDERLAGRLADLFRTPRFRIYSCTDVIGVEVAGACKNVYAIAVGMADGAGAGQNTKSMVMTRAAREMTRLGEALGGNRETFMGLAGMGDLIVTCTSPSSRNRRVGEGLGTGKTLDEVLAGMDQVAEGVKTTAAVVEIAEAAGVPTPIAREVLGVLTEGRTAREAYRGLLQSTPGNEISGETW